MRWLAAILLVSLAAFLPALPCLAVPAEEEPPPDAHLNDPTPTTIVVRVVAHGAMVLGRDVGGARVTITDVETQQVLAAGIQQGDAGDQNQIMRTPHLMEEPVYSARPAAAFTTTVALRKPTLVDITAEGPLGHPAAMQHASQTVLLIPGHNLTNDGIVLHLYGYIVQIEHPASGQALMAKDDVKLRASVRTLSGTLVRPHGDWDSRKLQIYGELLIGNRVIERLQMFYSNETGTFDAPFFVPKPDEAPEGIVLRVVATDLATGNSGVGRADFAVSQQEFRSSKRP
ncbi:MAG TPA: hypothetical protein VJR69_00015 [Nitrospira sp.]|nr:hypothetical protein [Nitrospira sp.]